MSRTKFVVYEILIYDSAVVYENLIYDNAVVYENLIYDSAVVYENLIYDSVVVYEILIYDTGFVGCHAPSLSYMRFSYMTALSYMRISYTTTLSYMRISYTTALSYMRISYTTAGLSDLGFLGVGPGGNDLGGPGPFGCEVEISPRANVRGIPISLRLSACVEMPLGQVRVHRRKCAIARCGCNFILKTRWCAYANTHRRRAQRYKNRPSIVHRPSIVIVHRCFTVHRHLIVASIVRPSSSFIVAAPSSHNRIIP